jgi:SAM-dependent methyltransferase
MARPLGVSATAANFQAQMSSMRERKLAKLRPYLRDDIPHRSSGGKPDYLSAELRQSAGIADTANVSSNGYDPFAIALINDHPDGFILDCGAGRRDIYFENVVNFEIVDYDTTDVLGVGEELPFADMAFDAVISIAVLEHVRNPFRCADEIVRVLKPGGRLICCVPFLQPYHGYPHHYFNMTHQGLRSLFEHDLTIDDHQVLYSTLPIWTLSWMLNSWANGLPELARRKFLSMRVQDLMGPPQSYLQEDFVRALSPAKNFELASATVLFATKPAAGSPPQTKTRADHYRKGRTLRERLTPYPRLSRYYRRLFPWL